MKHYIVLILLTITSFNTLCMEKISQWLRKPTTTQMPAHLEAEQAPQEQTTHYFQTMEHMPSNREELFATIAKKTAIDLSVKFLLIKREADAIKTRMTIYPTLLADYKQYLELLDQQKDILALMAYAENYSANKFIPDLLAKHDPQTEQLILATFETHGLKFTAPDIAQGLKDIQPWHKDRLTASFRAVEMLGQSIRKKEYDIDAGVKPAELIRMDYENKTVKEQ